MSGVYVITDGSGHFKIGIADNPMKRRQELQTGNPRQLRVVFWIDHVNEPYARDIERRAQMRLSHLKVSGEWFACDMDCAVWAVLAILYPGCTGEDEHIPEAPGPLELVSEDDGLL